MVDRSALVTKLKNATVKLDECDRNVTELYTGLYEVLEAINIENEYVYQYITYIYNFDNVDLYIDLLADMTPAIQNVTTLLNLTSGYMEYYMLETAVATNSIYNLTEGVKEFDNGTDCYIQKLKKDNNGSNPDDIEILNANITKELNQLHTLSNATAIYEDFVWGIYSDMLGYISNIGELNNGLLGYIGFLYDSEIISEKLVDDIAEIAEDVNYNVDKVFQLYEDYYSAMMALVNTSLIDMSSSIAVVYNQTKELDTKIAALTTTSTTTVAAKN